MPCWLPPTPITHREIIIHASWPGLIHINHLPSSWGFFLSPPPPLLIKNKNKKLSGEERKQQKKNAAVLTILLKCIPCRAAWSTHFDTNQSQPALTHPPDYKEMKTLITLFKLRELPWDKYLCTIQPTTEPAVEQAKTGDPDTDLERVCRRNQLFSRLYLY